MANSRIVLQLLRQLAEQMQGLQLWQTESPSAKALASTEPFCIDTLTLEQWLQFVLIPKLTAMIEQGLPLPTNVSIAPMAEQAYAQRSDLAVVISTLAALDAEMSLK